ncbi:STE23_1 [Sanghuangporus weigelae]
MQGFGLPVSAVTDIKDDESKWKFLPAQGDQPAHYVYTTGVQKSLADEREYRVIRLENGLQAVLVHDAKTDKAAACIDVAVGDFNDPEDMPGLAHFCEHLLFMGTKQFPKENEYDEYLTRNNGESNAFTSACDTTFFFSVASNALQGALERFSAFFYSPLFSESCVTRELNAIDSENSSYLQDDDWRVGHVVNTLARPGHPLRRSGIGNKKTLMKGARSGKASRQGSARDRSSGGGRSKGSKNSQSTRTGNGDEKATGLEIRRRVIEWWNKEYCAGRMSLAIVGKESLHELTRMAATFFSPIMNRGQDPLPRVRDRPYGKNELSSVVYIKTIADVNNVAIIFPIPDQDPLWRVKPAQFLAHLIGHEGPGSLHAYLKNKGWATALETSAEEFGRGASSFNLDLDLTKDGLKNYREVVQTCFKYINLLRSSELPKWFQEEIITLGALEFRFDEKVSAAHYAHYIAGLMELPIPRALILSGARLTWGWDESLVQESLKELVIDNSLIIVASQDHSVIEKDGPWLTEPWYGTKYMVEKMDDVLITAASAPNDIPALALPKPNKFIPNNVEVEKVEVPQPKNRPAIIRRSPLMDVWFKKDDQFWTPRAQVVIEARSPFASSNACEVVMTRLFAYLVQDALTEYSYDAELAGLYYDFSSTMRGVTLSLGGYNNKLHVLAEHILTKVKNIVIKEDRLELMKEKAQQELTNALLSDPYMLGTYYLSYLLLDREFTIEEQVAEVSRITADKLREHVQKLLSELKFTILVNGNFWREDASRIATTVEQIFGAKAVSEEKLIPERSCILPRSCNYVWELPVPNTDETNSCVAYYCHVDRYSNAGMRVVCNLLAQILQEPAFDTLRTKEQVAYIVTTEAWENVESVGWQIIIQSEKDPGYIETRIEAFLTHMREVLEKMPEQEFEEHKAALIHELTENLKNILEETSRFWATIRSGYFNFYRRDRDAELLKSINKDDVVKVFKMFLDPASPSRSKLSVHMRTQNPSAPKLSDRAVEKFFAALQKAGVEIEEEEFASLCEELPIAQARDYWEEAHREHFKGESHAAHKLLEEFDRLAKKYPQEGYEPVDLSQANVVFIKDGADFRQSLGLSGAAMPVEEYEVE